jgi:glycosyltransferase involved in cell wall biosynthesis
VIELTGGSDWRPALREQLTALFTQPGVSYRGRLPQPALYRELRTASVWPYFCDFPETSCVQSMEMMASGVIPVTTDLWALGQNVPADYRFPGTPQTSTLTRSLMLDEVVKWLKADQEELRPRRQALHQWAVENFDWRRVAEQWKRWIEEDAPSAPQRPSRQAAV